jgi:hypothetical protein
MVTSGVALVREVLPLLGDLPDDAAAQVRAWLVRLAVLTTSAAGARATPAADRAVDDLRRLLAPPARTIRGDR